MMDDAAEAGPEGDGVMTGMRIVMAGPRWCSKRAHGRIWGRPLPSCGTLRAIKNKKMGVSDSYWLKLILFLQLGLARNTVPRLRL